MLLDRSQHVAGSSREAEAGGHPVSSQPSWLALGRWLRDCSPGPWDPWGHWGSCSPHTALPAVSPSWAPGCDLCGSQPFSGS